MSRACLRALVVLALAQRPARCSDAADLSFPENVYVQLSNTCRSVMDYQYKSKNESQEMKKLFFVHLQRDCVRTIAMEDGFATLARPDNFNIAKQTKIIIHGFNDDAQSTLPYAIAAAYNRKDTFNVLLLDSSRIIRKWYIRSAFMTQFIGRRLANFLANLEGLGVDGGDVHLIGISLGAHVAGWAGKYYRRYKGRSLGRITGLDPAGPCFTYAPRSARLDRSDAAYVDVVHVNRGVQGVLEPVGHADFYVNGGGPNQPGCADPACSHQRATALYEESVRLERNLIGVRCASWSAFREGRCNSTDVSVLGYGSSPASRGVYYMRTLASAPFGLGMKGIKARTLMQMLIETFMPSRI